MRRRQAVHRPAPIRPDVDLHSEVPVLPLHRLEDCLGQTVLLQQIPEVKDRRLVRALIEGQLDLCEPPHRLRVVGSVLGLYQGGWLALERAVGIGESGSGSWLRNGLRWAFYQCLVLLGWVFSRVSNPSDLAYRLPKFVVPDLSSQPTDIGFGNFNPFAVLSVLAGFAVAHLVSYRVGGLANWLDARGPWQRGLLWVSAVLLLIVFWPSQQATLIYFQFQASNPTERCK